MPPFHYDPYVNRQAATIGGLIQHGPDAAARAIEIGGQARARATEISGQAWAQAIGNIGTQVSNVMQTIVKAKLDAPRREAEAIQLRGAQRAEAEDTATRKAFQDAKGDLPTAIKSLETQGDYITAGKLRSQLYESHLKGLAEINTNLDITGKRFKQASELLQGVPGADDPYTAYQAVLPTVRGIVGPDLAKYLPDDYDENTVQQAIGWGMKASDVVALRREATAEATAALTQQATKTGLVRDLTKAAAKWGQTIGNQDDWTKMREAIAHMAGDSAKDVLAPFPEQWSPEAMTKAAGLLRDTPVEFQHETVLTTGKDGKPFITEAGYNRVTNQWFAAGDTKTPLTNVRKFERDPRTGAVLVTDSLLNAVKENPEIYGDLTDSVKSALWADPRMAGFAPPPSKDKGASRAVSERWRTTSLLKIRTDLANGVYGAPGPEADAAAKADSDEIERSYKAQIGTPAPPKVKTAPAPSKAAAGAVPQAVQDALKDTPPGSKVTGKDGSIWFKWPDGTITPGR